MPQLDLHCLPRKFNEVGQITSLLSQAPGCVHADLFANNLISDPFFSTYELMCEAPSTLVTTYLNATSNTPATTTTRATATTRRALHRPRQTTAPVWPGLGSPLCHHRYLAVPADRTVVERATGSTTCSSSSTIPASCDSVELSSSSRFANTQPPPSPATIGNSTPRQKASA
jgi:hypothetical protein